MLLSSLLPKPYKKATAAMARKMFIYYASFQEKNSSLLKCMHKKVSNWPGVMEWKNDHTADLSTKWNELAYQPVRRPIYLNKFGEKQMTRISSQSQVTEMASSAVAWLFCISKAAGSNYQLWAYYMGFQSKNIQGCGNGSCLVLCVGSFYHPLAICAIVA